MRVENVFFLLFDFLGYQNIKSIKSKSNGEIVFICITIALVVTRTVLSFLGLKTGDIVAMKFSLVLNLIPVLQTIAVLLRKSIELDRKRNTKFIGVFRTTNAFKKANPYLRRLFILMVFLSGTIIASILYLRNFSRDNSVAPYFLEFVVWIYMILSTTDGFFEQLVVLFSAEA